MKNYIIILLLVLFYSCSNNSTTVKITGHSDKDTPISMLNANIDFSSYNRLPYIKVDVDKDGNINFVSDSLKEGFYRIDHSCIVYLRPGLEIEINRKGDKVEVISHKYMNKLHGKQINYSDSKITNNIKNVTFEEHCKAVDNFYKDSYNFLNEIDDDRVKQLEKYRIDLSSLMLKLKYCLYDLDYKFTSDYDKLLSKVKFDNPDFAMLPKWKKWLQSYFYIIRQKDKLTDLEIDNIEYQCTYIEDKTVKKAWVWDRFLGTPAYDDFAYKNLKFAKTVLTDQTKINKIDTQLEKIEKCLKGRPALEFELEDLKGNKVKLSDFKGKYVYIDFWGVTCPACIMQMPHLKKIEHKYKGKDIKFLSICLSNNIKRWKQLVKKHNVGGVNLVTKKDRSLSAFYNIRYIPRFVLIDKYGNIINSSAPRPSEKELVEVLDNLLLPGIKFDKLNFDAARKKAKRENKLLFVDCYTSWCGPCKMLSHNVFPQGKVGKFFNRNFINLKIDMEKGEGPALRKKYGVKAFPTMLYLTPDGEVANVFRGLKSADELIENAKSALDPSQSLEALEKKYNDGDRSPGLVVRYINTLNNFSKRKKSTEVAKEFLKTVKGEELLNDDVINILSVNRLKYNSEHFNFIKKNFEKFKRLKSFPKINIEFMMAYRDHLSDVTDNGTMDELKAALKEYDVNIKSDYNKELFFNCYCQHYFSRKMYDKWYNFRTEHAEKLNKTDEEKAYKTLSTTLYSIVHSKELKDNSDMRSKGINLGLKLIDTKPKDVNVYFNLSYLYKDANNKEKAKSTISKMYSLIKERNASPTKDAEKLKEEIESM